MTHQRKDILWKLRWSNAYLYTWVQERVEVKSMNGFYRLYSLLKTRDRVARKRWIIYYCFCLDCWRSSIGLHILCKEKVLLLTTMLEMSLFMRLARQLNYWLNSGDFYIEKLLIWKLLYCKHTYLHTLQNHQIITTKFSL